MNISLDVGNSLAKVGIFETQSLIRKEIIPSRRDLEIFLKSHHAENLIVSSVAEQAEEIVSWANVINKKIILGPDLPLPIHNRYATPSALSIDRLAAACGAWSLFPNLDCLVIDVGTCINYELISQTSEYLGGAISPGIVMRFEAMHRNTAKLPLASPVENTPLMGNTTIQCLQSGVMNGTLEEIKGTIGRYKIDYPDIRVIL